MFGRATITLGIGPHSSFSCFTWLSLLDLLQMGIIIKRESLGKPVQLCTFHMPFLSPTDVKERKAVEAASCLQSAVLAR